jgi:hypothetical protein
MFDTFTNTKYLLLEKCQVCVFATFKWHMIGQHLVHDYTDTPPVHFLKQFRLGTTTAVSDFHFFTLFNTFVQGSPETENLCILAPRFMKHFYI